MEKIQIDDLPTDTKASNFNIQDENEMAIDSEIPLENNLPLTSDMGLEEIHKNQKLSNGKILKEFRKVVVPANKLKNLKENWVTIVKAIVEHMKLEIRMNVKSKCIELRTGEKTTDTSAMQKSEEFLKAYLNGFELSDAIALLRLEDLYFETFEIKDVKNLKGDHLSRCIGRICGEKGKTKYAIENATRTRMIIQGQKISLLGAHTNVAMARNAICSLILGAQPGKVYSQLRIMGRKINENI